MKLYDREEDLIDAYSVLPNGTIVSHVKRMPRACWRYSRRLRHKCGLTGTSKDIRFDDVTRQALMAAANDVIDEYLGTEKAASWPKSRRVQAITVIAYMACIPSKSEEDLTELLDSTKVDKMVKKLRRPSDFRSCLGC